MTLSDSKIFNDTECLSGAR